MKLASDLQYGRPWRSWGMWFCPVCQEPYPDREQAEGCLQRHDEEPPLCIFGPGGDFTTEYLS
jgi:hypothetical protein